MGLFDKFSNKTIKEIRAYEILDSRGFPTVACSITLGCGAKAKAFIPSGASTGKKEALELRDGDKKRFNGKSFIRRKRFPNKKI